MFQLAPDGNEGGLRVIAVSSDRIVNFRLIGDNYDLAEDGKPITRILRSSHWKMGGKLPVPRLEQPNLVEGVPAAGSNFFVFFYELGNVSHVHI